MKWHCDYLGGCITTSFWVALFVVPFTYYALEPSKAVLLDKNGNVDSISKSAYCLFNEESFYKEQKKLIDIQLSKIIIPKPITKLDLDMKRIDMKVDSGHIGVEYDYREQTPDDIADDTIAELITADRKKENDKVVKELEEIKKFIFSKYPHIQ